MNVAAIFEKKKIKIRKERDLKKGTRSNIIDSRNIPNKTENFLPYISATAPVGISKINVANKGRAAIRLIPKKLNPISWK